MKCIGGNPIEKISKKSKGGSNENIVYTWRTKNTIFRYNDSTSYAGCHADLILMMLKKNINPEKVTDMAVYALLGGMIGARIGYILFYSLDFYLKNPIEILKIHEGGMSIHGGIVGGIIASLIFIKKNKGLKILELTNLAAPPLILAQAIGRIGCDVYGVVMKNLKFWGVPVNGYIYHPAQLYEFVLNYLLFFYLWRKRKSIKHEGQLFGIYLIGFATIRSIVELFRGNPKILGLISVSHLLSLILIIVGIVWLRITAKKSKSKIEPQLKCFPLYIEITVFYGGRVCQTVYEKT